MSRRKKYRKYLKSPEWRAKREQAFAAYGRRCNRCGATDIELHVHHKRYAEDLDSIPVSWLEVLCKTCHKAHHDKSHRERRQNRAKNKRRFSKKRKNQHLVNLILDHNATEPSMSKNPNAYTISIEQFQAAQTRAIEERYHSSRPRPSDWRCGFPSKSKAQKRLERAERIMDGKDSGDT